MTELPRLSS